jgi:hypothetical protein
MSETTPEFKPEMEPVEEPLKAVAEAVTTSLKRAYTMSDLKKEQLTKARARALELRTALNAIKPPKVKPVKVKQPSKLEIEISEIKKQTEPIVVPVVVVPKEPVVVVPKEPVVIVPKKSESTKKLRLLPQKKVIPLEFQRDKVSGFFIL